MKDGLNAIPTSNKEKADCKKILSPQELHQVIIGPPLVDFSKVCLRSTSRRDISIVNNLDTNIHVVVQVCIINATYVYSTQELQRSIHSEQLRCIRYSYLLSIPLFNVNSSIEGNAIHLVTMSVANTIAHCE